MKRHVVLAVTLALLTSLSHAQFGSIKRALECGTIGKVGLDRCKEDTTPTSQYHCDDGGSAQGLRGLEQAIGDGMRDAGFSPGVDGVYVFRTSGGLICFQIRLDAQGRPLPSMSCIAEHIAQGNVKDGSVIGSKVIIVGCIQQAGKRTRTTARQVNVETGVIGGTGKGDAPGTDGKAARDAARDAFNEMKGKGGVS